MSSCLSFVWLTLRMHLYGKPPKERANPRLLEPLSQATSAGMSRATAVELFQWRKSHVWWCCTPGTSSWQGLCDRSTAYVTPTGRACASMPARHRATNLCLERKFNIVSPSKSKSVAETVRTRAHRMIAVTGKSTKGIPLSSLRTTAVLLLIHCTNVTQTATAAAPSMGQDVERVRGRALHWYRALSMFQPIYVLDGPRWLTSAKVAFKASSQRSHSMHAMLACNAWYASNAKARESGRPLRGARSLTWTDVCWKDEIDNHWMWSYLGRYILHILPRRPGA